MEQLVADIKTLTGDLFQKQPTSYEEVIEKLFSKVCGLEDYSKVPDPQLEECAVQLWNWAVTRNVGTTITTNQKARVRHAACCLLYCCEPENPSEGVLRKQILMARNTGRTWLDCKDLNRADTFLNLAVRSLETLYSRLISRGEDAPSITSSKEDVEKELLRILPCQAESALSQGNHQEAVVHVQRCRELLFRIPKDTACVSVMCYNFGLNMYKARKFEESTFWLSQSYDIGKMNAKYGSESEVQAKTLRILATVYLEWDCQRFQEKALSAVTLANKECTSTFGLFLKIRILLRCEAPDDQIRGGLHEMLEATICLADCLSAVNLLISQDREVLAFEYLKLVSQRFESSPDLGAALVLHVELLLQKGKELLGKQKIEEIVTGHYTGRQLSPQALARLHVILWDQACRQFEDKRYSEALQWYNYSLSFFKGGLVDPNLAKLQRNRASCFLQLKQLEKAKEAIKEAQRCDPDSVFTHFCVYKMAMLEHNVEKATEALNAMGVLCKNPQSSVSGLLVSDVAAASLLSLAAQMALEVNARLGLTEALALEDCRQNDQQEIAVKALESLCGCSEDDTQVLSALRCLVRLALSARAQQSTKTSVGNLDALLPYLRLALQKVVHQTVMTAEQRAEEATWFRKIAWNSALQCQNAPDRMRDFFLLSFQLSQQSPSDRTLLMGQRTCLLMVVAASLELCRKSVLSCQTEELTQVLEQIQICWEVWRTLKATGQFPSDPTDKLLLLYEFEARAKLNDPQVEAVLESVLELENVDTKVLETMAGLAMEPPAHFPLLCKKALRAALCLHKKQPEAELACSRCLHSLISLSLPAGVSEVEAHVLEELWDYYDEALAIIAAAPDVFPEMEILWLLTCAWNTGILLYSLTQYTEAERWCGLAMSFLRHLGTLQESYEKQMSLLYGQVLDRLDKSKKILMEE